ncbi:unnamed protein product [Urochloa decumbens]|uniref:F-box domain-containing protein n=1 Tax=Urochloa decumbens TaxID=240449 RepID=A0ABC9FLL9_9POAL
MAPPRRQPAELMDDAVAEILLRFPPVEPACLVRASVVCKPWRRVVADPSFHRRYREFHGVPPLLGFLRNTYTTVSNSEACCFVPNTATPPLSLPPLDEWGHGRVLDCRHSRVLLYRLDLDTGMIRLAVWDPIAGDRKVLPGLPHRSIPSTCRKAAVLCSTRGGGCDHLNCHDGPFQVVLLGSDLKGCKACVCSSEGGTWTAPASVRFQETMYINCWSRPTLVGDDDIYFRINIGGKIIKYDLGKHCLSALENPPFRCHYNSALMVTEDVLLGAAIIKDYSSLQLWSREVKQEGVARWVQCSVIKLDTLIPIDSHLFNRARVCFTEGLGIVFVNSDAGLFSIDVKSWRVKKVSRPTDCYECIPFMCFYTPGHEYSSNQIIKSACLARASKVCKLWRRIVSDPDFTRRYREFHRTPPLLGFLHNSYNIASCPFPQLVVDCSRWWTLDFRRLWALDCRHNRILLRHGDTWNLIVLDPTTGGREEVPDPHIDYVFCSAMVICTVASCNHCDCLGGPFHVVFVGSYAGWVHGCVYSSEARAWGKPVSVFMGSAWFVDLKRGVLIGDEAYFTLAIR